LDCAEDTSKKRSSLFCFLGTKQKVLYNRRLVLFKNEICTNDVGLAIEFEIKK